MPNSSTDEFTFSSHEVEDLENVQTTSKLAVLAGCGALLSPLAMVHPLLLIFPSVAVVLSLLALVLMTPEKIGRKVAVASLGVALLFGVFAPSRLISRNRVLYKHAEQAAEEWLSLVSDGAMREAHQLTEYQRDRVVSGTSLDLHYTEPEGNDDHNHAMMEGVRSPAAALASFLEREPIVSIAEWKEGFEYELGSRESVEEKAVGISNVLLTYTLTRNGSGEQRRITLTLERSVAANTGSWRLANCIDPDYQPSIPRVLRKTSVVVTKQ